MTFREKIRTASDTLTQASALIDKAFEALDLTAEDRENLGKVRSVLIAHAQPHVGTLFDTCTNVRDMLDDIEQSINEIEDEAERRAEVIADAWDY